MLVLPNGDLGGGQETVRLLARHLDRTRYDVSVVCPPSPTLDRLQETGDVTCVPLAFPRVPRPRSVRRLASLIAEQRVDVLHTHLFHGDLYGFLATRLVSVPWLVSTIQGVNFDWRSERQPRRARWWAASHGYRAIYRGFDRVATCSVALRDAVCTRPGVKLRPDRVTVIHNSVDVSELRREVDAQTPSDAGRETGRRRRVVTVANFARFKGHPVLVEAMTRIPAEWDVEWWLVGDGPERPAVEALARRRGLAGRVRFLGYRRDVPAILRDADLFVLPSLWEPFGIAVVEAMVLRVPVAAVRAGGVPEIVTDEETGLLAEPGDAEGLAKNIRRLLSDPGLRDRLATRAAHEAAARFDAPAMAAKYEALYADRRATA